MPRRSFGPRWSFPTWRDTFDSVVSVQCSSCGREAHARFAVVRVPIEDRDEAESRARTTGLSWRIDLPSSLGPRSDRGHVLIIRAADLIPRGCTDGQATIVTCAACASRHGGTCLDYPRRAWFRCWVHGRMLHALNRAHLVEIRRYLGRTASTRREFQTIMAGPVHKLHGDIMRHRAEAIRRIDQMLEPTWSPWRSKRRDDNKPGR